MSSIILALRGGCKTDKGIFSSRFIAYRNRRIGYFVKIRGGNEKLRSVHGSFCDALGASRNEAKDFVRISQFAEATSHELNVFSIHCPFYNMFQHTTRAKIGGYHNALIFSVVLYSR